MINKILKISIIKIFLIFLLFSPNSYAEGKKDRYFLSCIHAHNTKDLDRSLKQYEVIIEVGSDYAYDVGYYPFPAEGKENISNFFRNGKFENLIKKKFPKKPFISSDANGFEYEFTTKNGNKLNFQYNYKSKKLILTQSDLTTIEWNCIKIGNDISNMITVLCKNKLYVSVDRIQNNIIYSIATFQEFFDWKNIFDRGRYINGKFDTAYHEISTLNEEYVHYKNLNNVTNEWGDNKIFFDSKEKGRYFFNDKFNATCKFIYEDFSHIY